MIPLIIILVFGVLVMRDQVPVVDDSIQRLLHPGHWQAARACREAALAAAREPAWARVLKRGEVHETAGGYYVRDVRIGERGEGGAEVPFQFQCYTDPDGRLVSSARE